MSDVNDCSVPRAHILIVDDDEAIRESISEYLIRNGYEVAGVADGVALDHHLADHTVDLVILDVMLRGEDGLRICRRLTAGRQCAVIMLSALGEETDRIVALELGADDYLAKPCNPRELLARVKAVLRQPRNDRAALQSAVVYQFLGWRMDPLRRELRSPEGNLVHLSMGEFLLFSILVEHAEQILDREALLALARPRKWRANVRAIDVQISRLRRKLGEDADMMLRTIRNEGYVFKAKVASLRTSRSDEAPC
jgi:two-component system OmpR family response regulator